MIYHHFLSTTDFSPVPGAAVLERLTVSYLCPYSYINIKKNCFWRQGTCYSLEHIVQMSVCRMAQCIARRDKVMTTLERFNKVLYIVENSLHWQQLADNKALTQQRMNSGFNHIASHDGSYLQHVLKRKASSIAHQSLAQFRT